METSLSNRNSTRGWGYGLVVTLAIIGVVVALSPVERTLGSLARLIYFHGAWVWAGKAAFAAAGLSGLVGLALPSGHGMRRGWLRASLALGWVGMFFWLTYLPLSLLVQKLSWGGIFWDEPRWRIPLMFGVGGVLLQAGLWMVEDLRITAAANAVFGAALWLFLGNIQNVLHPDSPIFQSDAARIQMFFVALLVLALVFGALLARLFFEHDTRRWK